MSGNEGEKRDLVDMESAEFEDSISFLNAHCLGEKETKERRLPQSGIP